MNISTKEFAPSRSDMYKLLVNAFFKKNMILKFSLVIMLFVVWLSQVPLDVKYVLSFVIVVYYTYIIFYYWIYTGSESNKSFYTPRSMKFTDEGIMVEAADGSTGNTTWSNLVKVNIVNNTFMLYISKEIFYFVPFSAFNSEIDLEKFKEYLNDIQSKKF